MINTDWSQFVFAHLDVSRRARSHAVRLILIFFRFISTPVNNASNASTQFLIPRIVLFNSPNSFDLKIWTKKRGICDILYATYYMQCTLPKFSSWISESDWKTGNWNEMKSIGKNIFLGLKYWVTLLKVWIMNFLWFQL